MDDGDEKMFMLSGSGIRTAIIISSNLFVAPLAFNVCVSYVNVLKMKCSLHQQLNNKFNGIRN